jgi:hypothetical protein
MQCNVTVTAILHSGFIFVVFDGLVINTGRLLFLFIILFSQFIIINLPILGSWGEGVGMEGLVK